jgi:short-subunit dehydrogenase
MKTWLITGASSGLGRIMAEKLLRRGDRVIGTARRKHGIENIHSALAKRLHSLEALREVAFSPDRKTS